MRLLVTCQEAGIPAHGMVPQTLVWFIFPGRLIPRKSIIDIPLDLSPAKLTMKISYHTLYIPLIRSYNYQIHL